jgi:PAS domain S-box-containing protein
VPSLAIGTVSLMGYAYGVSTFQGVAQYTPLALPTAATFIVVSAGLLFAHTESGIGAWLRADSPGALLLRRLLAATLVLPLLIGWLGRQGEIAGWYEPAYGAVLVATSLAGLGAALAILAARRIDRAHEQRLAAEAEVRRSDQLLRAISDGTPDAVYVKDADGRYAFINRAGAAFAERPIDQIVGRTDFELFPEPAAKMTREHDQRAMAASGPITYEDSADRRTTRRTFLVTKGPLRDEGRVVGVFGVARDISARKRAEAALEDANRELEAFSYSVSHDLRAPLRALDGFSLAVLEDHGEALPEDGRDYLVRIRAAAQRMGRLIDDLLALSRVSRSELRRSSVDLSKLAGEILAELRSQDPERVVDAEVAAGLVATADLGLSRALLENLLGNAWKYTSKRERARIEFGEEVRGDGVRAYFVRDDGAGFDMTYAHKLFTAFQRLHAAEEFQGTGIGLATVNRIVRRHGGRVWAEGAVGRGATFHFTLPAEER